jgi:hypothetical protein
MAPSLSLNQHHGELPETLLGSHDTFKEDLWDGASQSSHFFFEEMSSPLTLITQRIVFIY